MMARVSMVITRTPVSVPKVSKESTAKKILMSVVLHLANTMVSAKVRLYYKHQLWCGGGVFFF